MSISIYTERLDLIPMTPTFLRASLERNVQQAEQELQLSLPAGWPGDIAGVLAIRLKQLDEEPTLQPWLLRAISLREKGVMVGHIGFHTAPDAEYLRPYVPGGVEFGFTVFPSFRRQGYAREASVALMRWARQTHEVRRFAMTIRPDNHPSQALATQLGFVRIGSHIDDEDGLEDILEYRDLDDDAA